MPTVLLVEYRDDVFAQLADALANGGVRTMRVKYAAQAIRQYLEGSTDLILVGAEQPYESAWLLTAKLQLILPTARICVYMSRVSAVDVATSAFLGVDEPIESNGDVSRVAATLLDQFSRA
jgi:DNA-binding response OmpR family regulator